VLCQARPDFKGTIMSGILPKSEDVTLSDLRRLLALKDDAKVRELIARIPGIDELERKLNSVFLCDLDVAGTIMACAMLSLRWGWSRADVDRELVEHVAYMPWKYDPGHFVPSWRYKGPAASEGTEAPAVAASVNQAPPPPEANIEPVVLGGPDDSAFVWGKEKDPLPPAQYRVIKALVEARAKNERLSKDNLCNRTKDEKGNAVEDPVGALERLCRRDKDWRDVIDMAKVPGRGYGLKDKPPTPTQRNRETHPRRPIGG